MPPRTRVLLLQLLALVVLLAAFVVPGRADRSSGAASAYAQASGDDDDDDDDGEGEGEGEGEVRIDKSQDHCMLCQYVMERVIDDVNAAGLVPRGHRQDRTGYAGELYQHPAYLETSATSLPEGNPTDPNLAAAHEEETGEAAPELKQSHDAGAANQGAPNEEGAAARAHVPHRSVHGLGPYRGRRARVAGSRVPPLPDKDAEEVRAYQHDQATSSLAPHLVHSGVRFGPGGPAPPTDNSQPGLMNNLGAAERQLFAEVYKSMDLTLDAVCEQAMPNDFYSACEHLFGVQGLAVNLVTRSFTPQDLCVRLEMCATDSYLTKFSIHTPKPRGDGAGEGEGEGEDDSGEQ